MANTLPERRTVLIVDDEQDLLDLLKYNFEKEGFRTVTALDGAAGFSQAQRSNPDLIVLDIMMPKLNGVEVCQRIRQDAKLRAKPVIMLTARTEDQDYIEGLDVGADIYIGKPVSMPVLISQANALLRSAGRTQNPPDVLRLGALEVNRDRYLVVHNGEEIRLPRKEFDLLYFLVSNPGRVFRRQDLLDAVWGHRSYVTDRTVDVHVRKLREKLGSGLIATITGVGYKLKAY